METSIWVFLKKHGASPSDTTVQHCCAMVALDEDQGTPSFSGPGDPGEGGGKAEAHEEAADACRSRRPGRPDDEEVWDMWKIKEMPGESR